MTVLHAQHPDGETIVHEFTDRDDAVWAAGYFLRTGLARHCTIETA